MQTQRLSDIIGPVMIGPSSSHTAGALRIAAMARRLCPSAPTRVEFRLYGSFAYTYRGHGTDRALCAGVLGMPADDLRIRDSIALAAESGMQVEFAPLPDAPYNHPNTVDVVMQQSDGSELVVRGESVGGGAAVLTRINDIDVRITGENSSAIIRQRDVPGVLAHIMSVISESGINIATVNCYRERRGTLAYTVLETDSLLPSEVQERITSHPDIKALRTIPADNAEAALGEPSAADLARFEAVDFVDGAALYAYCQEHGCSIAEAFRAREDALCSALGEPNNLDAYLDYVVEVMRASATGPLEEAPRTMGGLIGGEAHALDGYFSGGDGAVRTAAGAGPLLQGLPACATRYALAVLETNASMGRIVAAPTAGSSGVIPAVLLALQDERDLDAAAMREALLVAAAVGYLIARNATVSGAEGGCQAEIGSAAAMAAAAAAFIAGGSATDSLNAAGNALESMLGLVCDPVGGLVETPCQKRNATAALVALASADIALAGVANLSMFDETVEAMYKVGRSLPFELRESALGGMAATPSACAWCESNGVGGCMR